MRKVSVIIPVYNVEKYLEKCLKSVVQQTLKDIEIIVINDGSTDNSEQILKNFACKDNRITIIHQKNSGPSVARNKGLEIASGEYISFIDSDDWVDLNFLEKLFQPYKKIKIFGLTFAKIKYYPNKKEYIIFNQIKFSSLLYKHS